MNRNRLKVYEAVFHIFQLQDRGLRISDQELEERHTGVDPDHIKEMANIMLKVQDAYV